jgi:disulfide oxidoreductase YuzD
MVMPIHVEIIGAPVSCGAEVKDTWRELSGWIAGQLRWRYGDAVQVEYHDLFDVGSPTVPAGTSLPLILINGEVLANGGKLSLPLIRRAVEALGVSPEAPALVPNVRPK